MLSEEVLDELTRPTPSQEHVVALAWPSLTTSEHLQVIAAVQRQTLSAPTTPLWLVDLALASPEPIVRYLAVRHAYALSDPGAAASAAKVAADPSELVRLAGDHLGLITLRPEMLTGMTELQRLMTLRNWEAPQLADFLVWLEVDHGKLRHEEVRAAVLEFFGNPLLIAALSPAKAYHPEEAYEVAQLTAGMRKGWALCARLDKGLGTLLASKLPLETSLDSMGLEELVAMPAHVLEMLIYRDDHQVVRELVEHVDAHPGRFAETVRRLAKEMVEGERNARLARARPGPVR